MRSKWSLNTLIPTLVVGAGMILLTLCLGIFHAYQKSEYRQLSVQRLESMGPHIADITQRLILLNDDEMLAKQLQSLQQLPGIGLIAIVDEHNTVLHASDERLSGSSLESTELALATELTGASDASDSTTNKALSQAGEYQQVIAAFSYRLSEPGILSEGAASGHVVISYNLQESRQALRKTLWVLGLMLALLVFAIAGLIGYVLHRLGVVPLKSEEAPLNQEQVEVESMHKRLSHMVDDMVDELYVHDARTFTSINTNKSAQKNLGYSAEELASLKPWDFVVDHSRNTFDEFLEPLFNGSQSYADCESLHICKDGSLYPVRSRIQYMAHQSPPVLVTVSRDLSELRVQEEHARLRERAMEAVSDGIIITDAGKEKRIIVYVNRAISELSGYSEEELLGSNIDMLRKNNLDQSGLVRMQEALMSAESVQVQIDATRKDGSAYITDVSMSPVFNAHGELTHYIGIHRDVTRKLETEEKLHQAQKIKAIGHLSGGLAHDFNNLLSVIVGNLELLRMGTDDKAQVARIEGAEKAAHMGAHLTRRLLSFASQQRLVPVVTNVNDHVRNALALLAPTIGETISLTEDLAPDLWNTLTDPGEIETAVINLTINARDAMSQGGDITIRTANVDLDADGTNVRLDVEPGQYVRLCVMDNGPGISESVQDRIFEPFFTTKQDNEGSGLGLASVFGFAKQSGGCVNVSSAENRGTTFSVYLPRHVQVADDAESVCSVVERSGDGFEGIRILVVEDKEMVRQLTVQQLQSLEFETLEVESGVDAITLLETGVEVDIVLSDVVMPGGVSGYDVAEWVQKRRPHCHILLTSGFNDPADMGGTADVKGVRVLQKPYRLDELRETLHELLNCLAV